MARPLYCSVDPSRYYPQTVDISYDLGYMGTYSDDRQGTLENLMLAPAQSWGEGRFIVAGPKYPQEVVWPSNVKHVEHVSPAGHREFYCSQRFTLNLTRADMIQSGYAPSVRLFEAAACGTPIISDYWEGLNEFFVLGEEILLGATSEHTLRHLMDLPESERARIGERARKRVLSRHTAAHRAQELEQYTAEAGRKRRRKNYDGER